MEMTLSGGCTRQEGAAIELQRAEEQLFVIHISVVCPANVSNEPRAAVSCSTGQPGASAPFEG